VSNAALTKTVDRVALTMALALAGLASAACGGGGGGGSSGGPSVDLASIQTSETARESARDSDPGQFAADYLRGKYFTSIVVEVDWAAGRRPSPEALDLLVQRLTERCEKPAGIAYFYDEEIPAAAFPAMSTSADLEAIEDAHRQAYSNLETGVAAIYVLCVPGTSDEIEDGTDVVGLSYRGGSIALFSDEANQGDNPWVTTAEVEGTTLVHEAGHLLGLLNSGCPMVTDHEDKEHAGHDSDPTCVMYWAVQVPRFEPNIGDPAFAQFNAACIADLQAFGGK
jgi:hypothetical protein